MLFNLFHKNKDTKNLKNKANDASLQSEKNTLYAYANINSFIEQLAAGSENYLALLYPMIVSGDETLANMAADAIHAYMEQLNAPKIIKLSHRFRQSTSMEWSIDWAGVSPEDIRHSIHDRNAYLSVLRLGTFHPNGYFREKCMWALEDDEASFPYIALRLNDWVKPVRDTAYYILSSKLDAAKTDTAIEMLPFISQTSQGMRYTYAQFHEIKTKLTEKILLHLDEISLDKIRDYLPVTRRFLYKILLRPDILPKNTVDILLEQEKNGNEKALIISMILENYECSEEDVDHYIKSKSPIVRKKALASKYDRLGGAWAGLEEYLLDTAKGIRSDVCYILRKHTDFDILSYYKAKLHTPKEAVAILGIAENGTAKDADVLAEYVYSETPRLIKNAMKALSELGASGLEDIYWSRLNDTDVTISKAAYDAICRSNIHYRAKELYRAYQNCENRYTKKYLLYLLVKEPSWERLPYLLLLYKPYAGLSDPDEKRTSMLICRALRFRSVYGKITKEQAEFIVQTMNTPGLEIPERMKKEILFDLAHIAVE